MLIVASVSAFLSSLLVWQLRKFSYSLLDPMVFGSIGIPLSGALVAALSTTDLIGSEVMALFMISAFGYFIGSALLIGSTEAKDFLAMIDQTVHSISARHCVLVVSLAISITLALGALGLQAGAGGDARQEFARAFRPLVLVQAGLFYLSLLLLLHRRLSSPLHLALLLLLILPTLSFSGKSFALPLVYHFGLKMALAGRRPSVQGLAVLAFIGVGGFALMTVVSYGASSLNTSAGILLNRLWMSGDVYIYAYQQGALDSIRHGISASFIEYVLHPITALFGYRAYEVPLGAMLASDVLSEDVLTGPNAQLPVLLDLYYHGDYILIGLLSAFFGFVSFSLRRVKALQLLGSNPWACLCMLTSAVFLPHLGFIDFSLVLINVLGIAIATSVAIGFLIVIEMFTAPTSTLFPPAPTAIQPKHS